MEEEFVILTSPPWLGTKAGKKKKRKEKGTSIPTGLHSHYQRQCATTGWPKPARAVWKKSSNKTCGVKQISDTTRPPP